MHCARTVCLLSTWSCPVAATVSTATRAQCGTPGKTPPCSGSPPGVSSRDPEKMCDVDPARGRDAPVINGIEIVQEIRADD